MPTTLDDLKEASVDEAPDDVLDPANLPPEGATVRIEPYIPMKFRDIVTLYFYDELIDYIPIAAGAVDKDVEFPVTAQVFIDNARDDVVEIYYEVQFEGVGPAQKSAVLPLRLYAGFEADAKLDLSGRNYIAAVEKSPLQVPDYARLTRTADWGSGPYTFSSSDAHIALVDESSGQVTARRNGQCTISATDSSTPPQTQHYSLTIQGIQELHFLTHDADWEGMKNLCAQAGLEPVTLTQIKQFWTLYNAGLREGVGTYLGWLNYPVWTGSALGAGTAWQYDLNGNSVNDNADGSDTQTHHQAVGIYLP
ncbi:Ig-like domain-containing protein [Pseudomonas corrugata]